MDDCCNSKSVEMDRLAGQQKNTLWVLLGINLTMFFVEGFYGLMAHSTALLADSLDMLGDAFIYGMSLFVADRSSRAKAGVSLVKGIMMTALGVGIVVQAIYRFLEPVTPSGETMSWLGGLALAANLTCAALLLKHRGDDLNMRSTWLCTRNDAIANLGVILAGFVVAWTGSRYPDLVVGVAISILVLKSAVSVVQESVRGLGR